ncbi:hypothetical protein ID866_12498 [Astraeus odoratus]|nr:hypothetical protein ID866_12498 [Astraeus odoratus]
MDVANGHLDQIASTSQSNGQKMQWHHLLMEGLVGQQQGPEELKELQEMQGEWLGGQEETKGVPGGAPEDEPEDVPGNELGDGAGAEDGTGEEGQQSKGKEKAL